VSGMRADVAGTAGKQDFGHLEGRETNGTSSPHHNCTILIRGARCHTPAWKSAMKSLS
jgi:hypothetical protein